MLKLVWTSSTEGHSVLNRSTIGTVRVCVIFHKLWLKSYIRWVLFKGEQETNQLLFMECECYNKQLSI